MGKFVAPETGKYQISVTNNGEWDFYPKTLDEDLAVIESAKSSCDSNKTYTFKTISLKKNQVIYVYLEQNFTDSSLLAGKVTIKQQSAAPSLNKTSATLKTKQTERTKPQVKHINALPVALLLMERFCRKLFWKASTIHQNMQRSCDRLFPEKSFWTERGIT